jgi:CheY-like chemotaxis protein
MNALSFLVIEDTKTDILVIKKAFERLQKLGGIDGAPAKVDYVENMHDALEHLSANEYDLVITDLRLPDAGGLDIIKAIRSATDKPVVIISGSYLTEVLDAALERGAARYLKKGDSWVTQLPDVLKSAIQEYKISQKFLGLLSDVRRVA